MSVFGPPAAADVLREALAPFKDLGVLGANTIARRQGFSSDYGAFNEAGLPGINVVQDPIEYNSYTWHSNLDTYERIVEEDVIKSAIVIAATVYHLATRDELLPRFSEGRDAEAPRRPAAMNPEVAQLLAIIDQAYNKPSWHGTNLRGSVRRVTAAQAAWRPSRRHNIWEIVVHAAYWKYAAARRFTGGARGSFR